MTEHDAVPEPGRANQEMLAQGLPISLSETLWERAWSLRLFLLTPLSQGSDISVFPDSLFFSFAGMALNQLFVHLILMWCLLLGGPELTQDPVACSPWVCCFKEVSHKRSWTWATQPHSFFLSYSSPGFPETCLYPRLWCSQRLMNSPIATATSSVGGAPDTYFLLMPWKPWHTRTLSWSGVMPTVDR